MKSTDIDDDNAWRAILCVYIGLVYLKYMNMIESSIWYSETCL